eukprot:EG_transcript_31777
MAAPFSLLQQLPGKSDLWLQLRGSEAARTALSVLQAHHTLVVDPSKPGGPLPPRSPKSPYGSLPAPEPLAPGVLDCCPRTAGCGSPGLPELTGRRARRRRSPARPRTVLPDVGLAHRQSMALSSLLLTCHSPTHSCGPRYMAIPL